MLKVLAGVTNNYALRVKKMNIIMVCESAQISGGAEKVAIQEAIELASRGFRVGYIAGNDSADAKLSASGVELLLLDTKSFFEETNRKLKLQKLRANFAIEEQVRSYFRGFSPSETIVHLHTFRLRLSGIVAHIAQDMGFKTITHNHDYSPVCPTSLWFDHRTGANCTKKPMSLSCITCECQNQSWKYKLPKLTSFFWNQSIWAINRRSNTFLHISDLEQSTTDQALGPPKTPQWRIPPISGFMSEVRVLAETNPAFIFIGRLTQEKGVESFLQCASEAQIDAVVIGDGPLRERLEREFPFARFTGWLEEPAIAFELRKARALVGPSLWRETLCLSVIDAMQMGVPCIVSENVGAKQYIKSSENGIVFADQGLLLALQSFAADSLVQQMSEQAFTTFHDSRPTIKAHVDELVKIYEICREGHDNWAG